MKIYDITVPITPQMPVWPGDSGVSRELVSKISDGDNANVSHLSMGVHTGTHVDAPFHFIEGAPTLEKIPLETFIGRAIVIEIPDVDLITAAELRSAGIPPKTERLLIKTRNSNYWADDEKSFQPDFVALSPDAADWAVSREIRLIGIDYLSIAPFKASRPTHQILLSAGVAILEGIDLSEVVPGEYKLYCLPLKLDQADGAPARVILETT
jgi:arylformamidase